MKNYIIICDALRIIREIVNTEKTDKYNFILITSTENLKETAKDLVSSIYITDYDSNDFDEVLSSICSTIEVTGIYCPYEDYVEKLGAFRTKYNIPFGLTEQASIYFRNKVRMKDLLKKFVRVPDYSLIKNEQTITEFIQKYKRCVIKPINGSGSENTYIVNTDNRDDICEKIRTDLKHYEIEEFISGEMYHVDSIVFNSQPIFVTVAKYNASTLNALNSLPLFGFFYSENYEPIIKDIKKFNQKVISNMPIKEGITHMEVFRTPSDKIVFCEIAGRGIGAGVSYAISDVYGVGPYKEGAYATLGIRPDIEGKVNYNANGGYLLLYCKPGTISKISSPNDFKSIPELKTIDIKYKTNQITPKPTDTGGAFVAALFSWRCDYFYQNEAIVNKILDIWEYETEEIT